MTTVRVRLAEVPTDVLVYLADQPQNEWFSPSRIAAALAPEDADHAQAKVGHALEMLRTMGYVIQNRQIRMWAATREGWQAVQDARKASR